MKIVQKYLVFGLFMTAGLIFAGCGDSGASGGGGGAATETPADDAGSSSSDEGSAGSDEGSSDNASTATGSGDLQLVSLNVPNMTWGGCAVSVRNALAEVDGIKKDSIEADTGSQTVKFMAPAGFDLDAKLADYKDHSHLKGWSKASN